MHTAPESKLTYVTTHTHCVGDMNPSVGTYNSEDIPGVAVLCQISLKLQLFALDLANMNQKAVHMKIIMWETSLQSLNRKPNHTIILAFWFIFCMVRHIA